MLNERVTISGRKVLAQDIALPDTTVISLFLSRRMDVLRLEYLLNTAQDLLKKIQKRVSGEAIYSRMTVEIPNIKLLGANSLPKEEKNIVERLWKITNFLAKHLIPNANVVPYVNGKRYEGMCWLSEECYDEENAVA